jgi:hypothetical protein
MSEEQTDDPTTFTFNWHDLDAHDNYSFESFVSWFLVHLVVPTEDQERTSWYDDLSARTDKFQNVELKILINGVEGNTRHALESIHHNMVRYAQDAAVEELRKIEEFNNLKRAMRALEGAVRDRLESVARGFGLTLRKVEDD